MEDPKMMRRKTRFGSLEHYEKGGVEVINDDPRNYAFSNIFEVASKSEPYEKVAVGKNLKYVLEAIRAEGTSPWYTASHDESAIIMDGEVRNSPHQARHAGRVRRARGHHDAGGDAQGQADGPYRRAARPHGAIAQRGGVPVARGPAERDPAPERARRSDARAMARYLPKVKGKISAKSEW